MSTVRPDTSIQGRLADITRLLETHRVLDTLTHRQEGRRQDLVENLQRRQNLTELHRRLQALHPADVAYVLETLPLDDRLTVWTQVGRDQAGLVLVEVSEAVRETLVEASTHDDLIAALTSLDPEDLGYITDSLPPDVVRAVTHALDTRDRSAYEEAVRYPPDSVGHHMTRELVAVPEHHSIRQVLAGLRARGSLARSTDRLFVIDVRHLLKGSVLLTDLLLREPTDPIVAAIETDTVTFTPAQKIGDAARAFERYDLVSAPVVDDRGKLIGRLTVDAVMDAVRDEADLRALKSAGLSGEEDVFAAPWDSARNRWPWLAINLVTAFAASRVIGQFEGTIERLASLAALMPIVASIGGNTGNQTMALVVRALATDRIQPGHAAGLLRKELIVSAVNGVSWGLVVGLAATALYASLPLGAVMAGAVVLNLLVAATAGVVIPLALHASGRDPANGSSVLLTFVTDGMGFFLFLGLATVFLA